MSLGLLHGLAERALGVAQPLRSQQALRSRQAPRSPEALPSQEPLRAASVPHDDPAHEVPPPPLPVRDAVALPVAGPPVRAGLTTAQRASTHEPAARDGSSNSKTGMARPPVELADARPPVAKRPVEVETVMPAVLAGDRLVAAHADRPSHAVPATDPIGAADPAPLLPPQPAAWPTLPMPAARAAAPQRAAAGIPDALTAERPTEVHVSIGRVELIAQPPASSSRPLARPRESTRSLADYLRTGAKGDA